MNPSSTVPNGTGTENASTQVGQVSSTAHEKIDQASDALHPTVDRLVTGAHQAVDKLAGVASQATQQFGEKSEQMKDMQQKLAEDCRLYVREKPVTALAIAAAAGFLLSRLLRIR
jgi:ElaB/YqjD/DUF883 family membrane-anchored ribosome-binding protein